MDIRYYEDEKRLEIDYLAYGVSLYVEIVRGEKHPAHTRQLNPDSHEYDLCLRVMGPDRKAFLLMGGKCLHYLKDWDDEFFDGVDEKAKAPKRSEDERRDFLNSFKPAVMGLPQVIKRLRFKKYFAPEYRILIELNFNRAFAKPVEVSIRREEEAIDDNCGWTIKIQWKNVINEINDVARHTALMAEKHEGTVHHLFVSGNHGAYANADGMTTKCQSYGCKPSWPRMKTCDFPLLHELYGVYPTEWGIYAMTTPCSNITIGKVIYK